MKKSALAIFGAFFLASGAASAVVCDGFTAASSVTVTASTSFIKQNFSNKCSANVFLNYEENDTTIAVCSGSSKGNFRFGGTSGTGAIVATGTKGTAATSTNTAATIAAGGCSAPG